MLNATPTSLGSKDATASHITTTNTLIRSLFQPLELVPSMGSKYITALQRPTALVGPGHGCFKLPASLQ